MTDLCEFVLPKCLDWKNFDSKPYYSSLFVLVTTVKEFFEYYNNIKTFSFSRKYCNIRNFIWALTYRRYIYIYTPYLTNKNQNKKKKRKNLTNETQTNKQT